MAGSGVNPWDFILSKAWLEAEDFQTHSEALNLLYILVILTHVTSRGKRFESI